MKKLVQNKFCNVSKIKQSLRKRLGFTPLEKVAKRSQRPSQMILVIASMGIERIAPGIPQKTSEMMTRTGLRVNRLARVSPSTLRANRSPIGRMAEAASFRHRERAGHLRQLR